jgi:hypothetical protein
MFSARRGETYTGQTLIGIDGEGSRTRLPYTLAGTGGFNQVRRQIRAKVRNKRAPEICETVAGRVAQWKRSSRPRLRTVQIVTATHNVNAFFAGDRTALAETIHAACEVPDVQPLAGYNRENR